MCRHTLSIRIELIRKFGKRMKMMLYWDLINFQEERPWIGLFCSNYSNVWSPKSHGFSPYSLITLPWIDGYTVYTPFSDSQPGSCGRNPKMQKKWDGPLDVLIGFDSILSFCWWVAWQKRVSSGRFQTKCWRRTWLSSSNVIGINKNKEEKVNKAYLRLPRY